MSGNVLDLKKEFWWGSPREHATEASTAFDSAKHLVRVWALETAPKWEHLW